MIIVIQNISLCSSDDLVCSFISLPLAPKTLHFSNAILIVAPRNSYALEIVYYPFLWKNILYHVDLASYYLFKSCGLTCSTTLSLLKKVVRP
jgi:hypothetical protein